MTTSLPTAPQFSPAPPVPSPAAGDGNDTRPSALGLGWLLCIYQAPRRKWRRYARTNARFAAILSRELVPARVDACCKAG